MKTFSQRKRLSKEYSGFGEASKNLRNRLLSLYGHPYSGEKFIYGNTNWISETDFSKDLQMNFGERIPLEDFRDESKTSYNQVFDFIELYYARALKDLEYAKRQKLFNAINLAFDNSGSVYEFNKDGQVSVRIDGVTAKKITRVNSILEPFSEAQKVYHDCIDGLISRLKDPKNIIGDMYIVLEEYFKKITGNRTFKQALKDLGKNLSLHPTQVNIIEKLKAYRGDVWGAAHAGNSPKPKEEDALWYIESVIAQINYINAKIKRTS